MNYRNRLTTSLWPTLNILGLLLIVCWAYREGLRHAAEYEQMGETLSLCMEGSQGACRTCSTWDNNWGVSCREMLIREKFGR